MVQNYDYINKINSLYSQEDEDTLVNGLVELTSFENYRPKIDHLRIILALEIEKINQGSNVIIVAGTNGKGEVCQALNYAISEHHTTALWSSPHVLTIQERMMFGREFINYKQLTKLFDTYQQDIVDNGLSYYEALFYVFVKHISSNPPEYLILEVGLGGRFDATNIFTPKLSAITSISRDHTAILGNKLTDILNEKYGVTRPGVKCLANLEQEYLRDKLKEQALTDGVELEFIHNKQGDSYTVRNENLVKRALEYLGMESKSLEDTPISKGRRELMTFRDINFIFIGAHNIDGHRKMLDSLSRDEKALFVLSFSTGREEQLKEIFDLYRLYPCVAQKVFVTSFKGQRALGEEELHKYCVDGIEFVDDWKSFLNEKYHNTKIYICGSYYFIGEFQKYLLSCHSL